MKLNRIVLLAALALVLAPAALLAQDQDNEPSGRPLATALLGAE